jgi:hypothetical protein
VSYKTKSIPLGTKTIDLGNTTLEYRYILADTQPTPAIGYEIVQVADLGDAGKVWMEYKVS